MVSAPAARRDPSPASSTHSTHSSTGHHAVAGPRQLRPLKSPLYVPAVLRPCDIYLRQPRPASIVTPPPPAEGQILALDAAAALVCSPLPLLPTDPRSPGLDSIRAFELGLQGIGKVTAPPSKEHWKADHDSDMCDDASCTRAFTYFTRKHHCRRCGNIFCDEHSTHAVPLDQDANYHPRGTQSRACAHCFHEYRAWSSVRAASRTSSQSSTDDQPASPATPSTPLLPPALALGPISCAVGAEKRGYFPAQPSPAVVDSFGSSVPRDWNWSTF